MSTRPSSRQSPIGSPLVATAEPSAAAGSSRGPRKLGISTRAVHGGRPRGPADSPVVTPVYQSVNHLQAIGTGEGLRYPRYGNSPNAEIVQRRLAQLDGAESAARPCERDGRDRLRAARAAAARRSSPGERVDLRWHAPARDAGVRDDRDRRHAGRSDGIARVAEADSPGNARDLPRVAGEPDVPRPGPAPDLVSSRRSWGWPSSSTRPSPPRSTSGRSSTAPTS